MFVFVSFRYPRSQNQRATSESLAVAMDFAEALIDDPGYRLGFNSGGSSASVNHLHFQVYDLYDLYDLYKLIFVWWRNTFENIRWINNSSSKYSYIITINNSQYITFYWKIEKWLCDEDLLTGMRRLKIIFFPSKSLDCTRPQGISFHWNLFFILWWRFWYKILNPVPFFYTFPLLKLTWWRLVLGTI